MLVKETLRRSITVTSSVNWVSRDQRRIKGTVSRDFLLLVFFMNQFPPAPDYHIRTVSNFFENSRRYSQVKVHQRYQRHRRQICHRCQRHRWQNCPRYQRHRRQICHRCQRHRRQILPPVWLVLLTPVANNGNNISLQRP
jgi:hypothetical protein